MTKAKPRVGIPLIEVRDGEIPGWIQELPRPVDPPLAVLLTRARYEYGWLAHFEWVAFFRKLVETLFERVDEPPYLGDRAVDFLTVLDLAPALITHGAQILPAEHHERLLKAVADLFIHRGYVELDQHRQRLGKQLGGDDLAVMRLHAYARSRGLTVAAAVEEVRHVFPHLSPEGVRSATRRAKQGPFHADLRPPVTGSGKRDAAPAGHGAAEQDDGDGDGDTDADNESSSGT